MWTVRPFLAIAALAALAACGDPLNDLDRLEDVDLQEDATAASATPAPQDARGGPGLLSQIFGGTFGPGNAVPGTEEPQVAPGQALPWGAIARACDTSRRDLGQQIEAESGYVLYDTNPASTAPRTHYVTGFDDDCPRQFTAALALFGDVGTHELTRYASGHSEGYSITDTVYETVRRAYCRVASGQICGSGLDRLARHTTFLSIYGRLGEPDSVDILLSDGEIAASDFDEG